MGSFVAPLLLGGLSAIGGLFGKSKTTSDSTTSTTPNFSPQQQAFIDMLTKNYTSSIAGAPAWNTAYESGGLRHLLDASVQANQGGADALAARGIDRTTAGAQAITNTGYQESNKVADFLTQAPIAEQANLSSLLSGATTFNASLPVGTTQTNHTVGTGGPSSPIAGFLGGGAQGLAAALGQQNAAKTLGDILKQIQPQTTVNASPTVNNAAPPSNPVNYSNPFSYLNDIGTKSAWF